MMTYEYPAEVVAEWVRERERKDARIRELEAERDLWKLEATVVKEKFIALAEGSEAHIRKLEAEVYALKKHDQCDHSDCHPTRCVIAAARAGIR